MPAVSLSPREIIRGAISASLFALAVDPLIRASLAFATLRSARIGLFADGVALVLAHIGRAIQTMLELFRLWYGATGVRVKLSKCAVVMGKPRARAEYERETARHGQVVGIAVYLGAAIDLGSAGSQ